MITDYVRHLYRVAAAAVVVVLFSAGSAGAFAGGAALPGETISMEVFRLVERHYVEPERTEPLKIIESAFSQFETHHPEVILSADGETSTAVVNVNGTKTVLDMPLHGSPVDLALFFDRVVESAAASLPPPADSDELRYELLRGGLRALDPHTQLFDPRAVGSFNAQTQGSFGGVGFTISATGGAIVVGKVMEETPAATVGLQEQDVILAVDGVSTEGMGVNDVVGLVRGDVGTDVTLTVGRESWEEPRELTARRAIIRMKSVKSSVVEESGARILHVAVGRFQAETGVELREAINSAGDIDGIVLDLRNNPGGLLTAAVSMADTFLDEGFIVATKKRSGIRNVTRASMFGVVRNRRPLVVLVNSRSASASEVVAAALMDRRALVIGERTFGKGSVQEFKPLSDGGGLLLTASHYLTPGFVSIQSVGVEPDIVLSPVIVGEGMRLDGTADGAGESRFKNAFAAADEPTQPGRARRLDYYSEERSGGAIPDVPGHPAPAPDSGTGENDFALGLAARILAAARGGTGTAAKAGLLSAAIGVLDDVRAGEGVKIEQAFARIGVPWAAAPAGQASVKLQAGLPQDVRLPAGKTVPLEFWARNAGAETAYRVWGRTESAFPPLDNLDLAFGTLEPGERRSATVRVTVPPSARERWDNFAFQLYEDEKPEGSAPEALAHTTAPPAPDIVYSYGIVTIGDDGLPGPEGSTVEPGERLQLQLQLYDRRGGSLSGVKVRVGGTAVDGIVVDERVRTIAELAEAGGTVSFDIRVREDHAEGEIAIPLSFSAEGYGVLLNDSITVAVGERFAAAGDRFPPRLDLGGAALRTERDSIALAVSAVDDEEMKDIYAYLDGRKIFYSRNDGGGTAFNATINVNLREGSNRIIVFARDQNDVSSQKLLFVFRSPPVRNTGL